MIELLGVRAINTMIGVRPVLRLDLSKEVWKKVGTVCTGNIGVSQTPEPTAIASVCNLGQIKSIAAVRTSGKKAKISWALEGNHSKYQIQYSASRQFDKSNRILTRYNQTQCVLKKLKKDVQYYVRMRVYTDKKYGKWSAVKTISAKTKFPYSEKGKKTEMIKLLITVGKKYSLAKIRMDVWTGTNYTITLYNSENKVLGEVNPNRRRNGYFTYINLNSKTLDQYVLVLFNQYYRG